MKVPYKSYSKGKLIRVGNLELEPNGALVTQFTIDASDLNNPPNHILFLPNEEVEVKSGESFRLVENEDKYTIQIFK